MPNDSHHDSGPTTEAQRPTLWDKALVLAWTVVLIALIYERSSTLFTPTVIALIAGLAVAVGLALALWQRKRGVRTSPVYSPTSKTTFLYAMGATLLISVPPHATILLGVVPMLAAATVLTVGVRDFLTARRSERP